MLCDVIENAKYEREQLIFQGKLEGKLETAKSMLLQSLSIDFIMRVTKLSKKQIEEIIID